MRHPWWCSAEVRTGPDKSAAATSGAATASARDSVVVRPHPTRVATVVEFRESSVS